MQFDPNSPIWLQVMKSIETDIAAGRILPGEKLPGGRELALSFSINPNTAARVYQELEKTGLCGTRRGMGTFVTEDSQRIRELREEILQEAIRQFLQRMQELGVSSGDAAEMVRKEAEKNA